MSQFQFSVEIKTRQIVVDGQKRSMREVFVNNSSAGLSRSRSGCGLMAGAFVQEMVNKVLEADPSDPTF